MAFATAGASGGTPGSPTPAGGRRLGTIHVSTSGARAIGRRGDSVEFRCCTIPAVTSTFPHSAAVRANTTAPSICCATIPGFTTVPQSMAHTRCTGGRRTRWTPRPPAPRRSQRIRAAPRAWSGRPEARCPSHLGVPPARVRRGGAVRPSGVHGGSPQGSALTVCASSSTKLSEKNALC